MASVGTTRNFKGGTAVSLNTTTTTTTVVNLGATIASAAATTSSASAGAAVPASTKLLVEVVKCRKLPQSEDEPLPWSASVAVELFLQSPPVAVTAASPPGSPRSPSEVVRTFRTATQRGSNNPFFNEAASEPFTIPVGDATATLAITVFECGRQALPSPLLYGRAVIATTASTPAGRAPELTIFLTSRNPALDAAGAEAEQQALAASPDAAPTVALRCRVTVAKAKREAVDVHADALLERIPSDTGAHWLVLPSQKPPNFAWWSLLADQVWCERFVNCLVETWRGIPSLIIATRKLALLLNGGGGGTDPLGNTQQQQQPRSGRSNSQVSSGGDSGAGGKGGVSPRTPRGTSFATPHPARPGGKQGQGQGQQQQGADGGLKTLADVVVIAWGCRRTHQVLCRLRLSAERFIQGESSIAFTLDDEATCKRQWRERSLLRQQAARRVFEGVVSTANDRLRSLFDRLWLLMALGIPAEGPAPVMGFDVRHKLSQAPFTPQHAEVLQSCLLRRIVPTLTQAQADAIAREDFDPRFAAASPMRPSTAPATATAAAAAVAVDVKLQAQAAFIDALTGFISRLTETLTDAEYVLCLGGFIPAVRDAFTRCQALDPRSAAGLAAQQQAQKAAAAAAAGPRSGSGKGSRGGSARKKKPSSASRSPSRKPRNGSAGRGSKQPSPRSAVVAPLN